MRENARVTSVERSGRNEMQYRQLGNTSLELSVIGFGASPFGDVFEKTNPMDDVEAVHFAIDRGINFFDVSPYYGLTRAESRLGDALVGRRQEIVLATKCGRYGAEEFDFSADRISAGLDDSLRRLRTDYVDLLQAHDTEFASVDQIVNETIPAMRELQRRGKARYIGITGYSLTNLLQIAQRAEVDTILSYCRYNLLVTDLEKVLLPFAHEKGVGVINASPLHMGALTERGAPDWHPASALMKSVATAIVDRCKEAGVDPSAVAIKFACSQSSIASTLVGMATRKHVEANLAALNLHVDVSLMEEIRAIAGGLKEAVWTSGLKANWG